MNNNFFNKEDTLEERLENEKIAKRVNGETSIEGVIKKIDNEIKILKEKIKEIELHRKIFNLYKD